MLRWYDILFSGHDGRYSFIHGSIYHYYLWWNNRMECNIFRLLLILLFFLSILLLISFIRIRLFTLWAVVLWRWILDESERDEEQNNSRIRAHTHSLAEIIIVCLVFCSCCVMMIHFLCCFSRRRRTSWKYAVLCAYMPPICTRNKEIYCIKQ